MNRRRASKVGKANWLPASDGGFALALRTHVPTEALLDGSYTLPNVVVHTEPMPATIFGSNEGTHCSERSRFGHGHDVP